jgi:hypothetical protein
MNLATKVLCGAVLSAAVMLAQIPVYNSNEDYCRENPHAPTCKDGKPINVEESMKAVMDAHSQAWCEMNPKDPTCPDKNSTKAKAKVPAARTTKSAPQTVVAPSAERTQEMLPPARHTKGSPTEIRLGELDWRLVQSNADLLIGINMASLLESELARTLIRQWTGKLGATAEEQDKLLASLGDVTETVISVQGKDVLAVLIGRMDDFSEGTQVGRLQTARISVDTVVMGSPAAITWARHRLNFGPPVSTPLKEAQQMAQAYHFWAWAKPSALAALGQGVRSSTPITKIKFGVNLKDQFRMDLILDTASAAIAEKVLASSMKTAPREMQSSIEGASVHCAMVLDRDVALTRFTSFMTDSVGQQFAPLLAAARQMAARQAPAAARPSPAKIVIEGLDDGPKTVTASTQQ